MQVIMKNIHRFLSIRFIFPLDLYLGTVEIDLVKRNTCPSCEVTILDMNDSAVAERARQLGLRSVPAIVIDGKVADCCAGSGPNEAILKAAGLGKQF